MTYVSAKSQRNKVCVSKCELNEEEMTVWEKKWLSQMAACFSGFFQKTMYEKNKSNTSFLYLSTLIQLMFASMSPFLFEVQIKGFLHCI